ncbi:uncharacterized protein LOC119640041, partial [Glossina fuscipes]|uniref:Uncharacterized protein LOC119640041 n=1 Tax=Glossina fuscipes TaxID=7396 RepID=A0A9C5Z642_9MUSC
HCVYYNNIVFFLFLLLLRIYKIIKLPYQVQIFSLFVFLKQFLPRKRLPKRESEVSSSVIFEIMEKTTRKKYFVQIVIFSPHILADPKHLFSASKLEYPFGTEYHRLECSSRLEHPPRVQHPFRLKGLSRLKHPSRLEHLPRLECPFRLEEHPSRLECSSRLEYPLKVECPSRL